MFSNTQDKKKMNLFLKSCRRTYYDRQNFSIKILGTEKVIPKGIFQNEIHLVDLKLNEGLEKIEKNAFKDCTGFMDLILPKSLKHLGSECFSGCHSLQKVSLTLENIESIGTNPFGESAYNRELSQGVRSLLLGTVSSQDTVQKWHQLYGFERRVSQHVTVGVDEHGKEIKIIYGLNFPAGNAIYPESDFGDTSPIGYEKTEPRIYPVCAQEASQQIPLILGTLDGSTYLIENWEYCRGNPSFLMEEAKEQHEELNNPKHLWSFVVNDVPVKTFDLQEYLMKVYYEEVNISNPIFIVWDNVEE